MKKVYLAIDIGASSGRHIIGWMENDEICTEEVYRFPNGVREEDGHLVWNMEKLLGEVKKGISIAKSKYPETCSLSIDTWGVDYVLLKGDEEVFPVYAYRDIRTEDVIPLLHDKISFSKLYSRTGTQFQPFNTIYQLYADKKAGRLDGVTDFLMIPEYLLWKLTGIKRKEYTNATTTGLINAETGEFDEEIIESLGYPKHLFTKLSKSGTVIGEYEGIRCVLSATHDTASAVEGIPMEGNEPYISSGTWSLLGVKTGKPITDKASEDANYSNEGGVGYNRYQKNIMGMWLINELKRDLCPDMPFSEIVKEAEESVSDVLVDANAEVFLAPKSMKEAFDSVTSNALSSLGDYFRTAYRSLALSYKKALEELERNTGRAYKKIYIVGGGAKNVFLNRLAEEFTGKEVVALPIEATALGNLKIQMEADNELLRG
ncbi:MAG: rhamnulokinase family protein [Candidatus Ornithospirochaeta sp.]